VDRLLRPRLTLFVTGPAVHVIAIACMAVALAMPVMELVPFSANGGGAALTAFGVSLVGRDGLLALIALAVTAATFGFVLYSVI
jgi:hypothetical protein